MGEMKQKFGRVPGLSGWAPPTIVRELSNSELDLPSPLVERQSIEQVVTKLNQQLYKKKLKPKANERISN